MPSNKRFNNSEMAECEYEGCQNIFQLNYKGRQRRYCSDICKSKGYRRQIAKKVKEYDFVRFQKQKLVALLSPKQKKKAHDWGLLD